MADPIPSSGHQNCEYKKVFIYTSCSRKGVVLERMEEAIILCRPESAPRAGTFINAIVEECEDGHLYISDFYPLPSPIFDCFGESDGYANICDVFKVPAYLARFDNDSYSIRNQDLVTGRLLDNKLLCSKMGQGYYTMPVQFRPRGLPRDGYSAQLAQFADRGPGFYIFFRSSDECIQLQGIIVEKCRQHNEMRYYVFVKGCLSDTNLVVCYELEEPEFPLGSIDSYNMRQMRNNARLLESTLQVSESPPEYLSVQMLDDDTLQLTMRNVEIGSPVGQDIYEEDWLGEFGDFLSILVPNTKYDWITLDKVTSTDQRIAWVVTEAKPKQPSERENMEKLGRMVRCLLDDEEINREIQILKPWAFGILSIFNEL